MKMKIANAVLLLGFISSLVYALPHKINHNNKICFKDYCEGKHVLTPDGSVGSIASVESTSGKVKVALHGTESVKTFKAKALALSVNCNKVCVGQFIGLERGIYLYKGYVKMVFTDGRIILSQNDGKETMLFFDSEIPVTQYVDNLN